MYLFKSTFVAVAIGCASVWLATPASADTPANRCGAPLALICSLIPGLPDLDHDVDLTKDPSGLNPDHYLNGGSDADTVGG